MNKNIKDLTNQRFEKLFVEKFSHTKDKSAFWLCKCDCGGSKIVQSRYLIKKQITHCDLCYRGEDLTGQIFNNWTVLHFSRVNNKLLWRCRCECGSESDVRPSRLRNYTSNSCKNCKFKNLTGKRFNKLTIKNYAYTKDKSRYFLCKCDCGTEKIIKITSVTSGVTLSCGCYGRELKRLQIGPKNPNWNPNLTNEDRNRDFDEKETVWSISVKRKYNFTCQKCGEYGGDLRSHHIKAYSRYPELRYILSNGICLCNTCHTNFHSKYGLKAFTLQNFLEFMNKRCI